jgi:hypothetical protein
VHVVDAGVAGAVGREVARHDLETGQGRVHGAIVRAVPARARPRPGPGRRLRA